MIVHGGLVSRTFGTAHAVGPYLYVECVGFTLHLWFRHFRLPWHYGIRWGYSLYVCNRKLLFGGRR